MTICEGGGARDRASIPCEAKEGLARRADSTGIGAGFAGSEDDPFVEGDGARKSDEVSVSVPGKAEDPPASGSSEAAGS